MEQAVIGAIIGGVVGLAYGLMGAKVNVDQGEPFVWTKFLLTVIPSLLFGAVFGYYSPNDLGAILGGLGGLGVTKVLTKGVQMLR